jgi:hypothetical protein
MRRTACLLVALMACEQKKTEQTVPDAGPPPTFDRLNRYDFNLHAQEHFAPVFWRDDANGNGVVEPDELVVLWGWPVDRAQYVANGAFTPAFAAVYESLLKPQSRTLSSAENARLQLLRDELVQGQPTLIETNTASFSAEEKAVLRELAAAAVATERLYALQHGTAELEAKLSPDDLLSRAVFHRNQSPRCVAPKTESNEACMVFSPRVTPVLGLYPAALQKDAGFCAVLEQQPNAAALMDHFSTVVADGAGFKAVPFSEAFAPQMQAVAAHLEAAAAALESPSEQAFQAYLVAAAKAFRTNDWEGANGPWVAMSGSSSKWYLRVGPDEVYAEPCSWKANFALQLARINPASLDWQRKLEPVKQAMEQQLATMAGPPYKARSVQFKLPDFIDVVLNAGDQRAPHGGTAGQSLPNWGPTAEKGGRTMVMTNLGNDLDSHLALRNQLASILCSTTMGFASTDPADALQSTVLHEAAHNLGPTSDYRLKGKTDDERFGGPLASMLEELKAESSALYFTWWLVDQKRSSPAEATRATVRDLAWSVGQLSRGMYDGEHHDKPYSQLAAVQLGTALRTGALSWKAELPAANGKEQGCLELDVPAWRKMVEGLTKRVVRVKGGGSRRDAEALKAEFVENQGDAWATVRDELSKRWLRAPKATYLYSF